MATILTERSCQHAAAPSEAEPADEVFEIVNEQGEVIGLEKRGVVHKTGLLHKAVYCFVFDTQGRLLIQRRSLEKKIGPGQWDLSVAEHLSPGETHRQAAERGLQEELGITATLAGPPITTLHKRQLLVPGQYIDNELVESFQLEGFSGQVAVNPAEVSEVKFIELQELRQQMCADPNLFTEWFRDEIQLLGFFQAEADSN